MLCMLKPESMRVTMQRIAASRPNTIAGDQI
jgi:hypothetical protein